MFTAFTERFFSLCSNPGEDYKLITTKASQTAVLPISKMLQKYGGEAFRLRDPRYQYEDAQSFEQSSGIVLDGSMDVLDYNEISSDIIESQKQVQPTPSEVVTDVVPDTKPE